MRVGSAASGEHPRESQKGDSQGPVGEACEDGDRATEAEGARRIPPRTFQRNCSLSPLDVSSLGSELHYQFLRFQVTKYSSPRNESKWVLIGSLRFTSRASTSSALKWV